MLNVARSIISYIRQFVLQSQSIEPIAPGATTIIVPTNRLFEIGNRIAIYTEPQPGQSAAAEIRTIVGKQDWTSIHLDQPLTMEFGAGSFVQKLLGPVDRELYIKGVHLGPLSVPPSLPCIVVTPLEKGTAEGLTLGAVKREYVMQIETALEVADSADQNEMILQIGDNVERALWLIAHPLIEPLRHCTLVDPTEREHTAIHVSDGNSILNFIYVQDENVFRQYVVMQKECYEDGTAKLSLATRVGYEFAAGAAVISSMRHIYKFEVGSTEYPREPWGGTDVSFARLTVTATEEQYRCATLQYPAQWIA